MKLEIKKRAEREGGQVVLITKSSKAQGAAALSALPVDSNISIPQGSQKAKSKEKLRQASTLCSLVELTPDEEKAAELMKIDIQESEAGQRIRVDQDTSAPRTIGIESSFPAYFKNKGYTKKRVLGIINKVLSGKPITEKQQDIFNDLLEGAKTEYQKEIDYVNREKERARLRAKDFSESDLEETLRLADQEEARRANVELAEQDRRIEEGLFGKLDISKKSKYTIQEGESNYYEISDEKRGALSAAAQIRGNISNSPLKVKFKAQGYLQFPQEKISSPADVAFAFRQLKNEAVERFYVVGIKNDVPISVEPISIGTIAASSASPFEPLHLLLTKKADSYHLLTTA